MRRHACACGGVVGEDEEEATKAQEISPNEGLWEAAWAGDLEAVKMWKAKGGDANWMHQWKPPGRSRQFTALHAAADQGHKEVAKYLVESCGADIDKSVCYGQTPLQHIAGRAGEGRSEVGAYLKMKAAAKAVLAAQRLARIATSDKAAKEKKKAEAGS